MSNSIGPIAYAIIAVVIMLATKAIIRRARNYKGLESENEQNQTVCFKAALWLYMVYSLGIVLAIVFTIIAKDMYEVAGIVSMVYFIVGMAVLALIGTLYGFVTSSRMYLNLDEETYTYFDGRKIEAEGTYRSIRAVIVSGGKIVIDSGKGYLEYIPLYFKKSGMLIAMLEQRRKKHLS